ncbi:MAG: helix-turn-helix domain-containing protein [Acidimicrobiales bacterium]|jgi:AcrR family transcriptional regulator
MGDQGISTSQPHDEPVRSAAQIRIIDAAVDLFARHGVGGTSLQMIATRIGVTKAAVYHQFNTKEAIVIAAAEAELGRLEAVVAAAEAEPSRALARDSLVTGMVDLAVADRRTVSTILNDPVIARFYAGHDSFRNVMDRMSAILVDDIGHEARVSTAMLTAAISGTVMHPLVARLDDDTLRRQLEQLARRLLPAEGPAPRAS